MAVTYTFSGSAQFNIQAQVAFGGDQAGQQSVSFNPGIITFAASGGTAPTMTGFVAGTANATTATLNLLLAHATNILNAFTATAVYSDGFTVAGSKVKYLCIKNTDAANTLTIKTPVTAIQFPVIQATAQSFAALNPGGIFQWYDPTGLPSTGLTTGTNDALTLVSNSGTCGFSVMVIFGP